MYITGSGVVVIPSLYCYNGDVCIFQAMHVYAIVCICMYPIVRDEEL